MDLVDRLFGLWTEVPTGDERDEVAFRDVYTDPVVLNGAAVPIGELVARYRLLHAAFEGLDVRVVDRVDLRHGVAVVLRQVGRHAGPLSTQLGDVEATGRSFDVLGIDLLTITEGRVSDIWVVADELGRLVQLGAVALAAQSPVTDRLTEST
jgi:hypothetical protein